MGYNFKKYCKDYENIENYDKALVDNFKGWHCHHRLETHFSDGERRLVDISQKELMALNMYYNRPAEELIFLPRSEHEAYKKGKYTGENNPRYGKHHTFEARQKISEANRINRTGRHWYNNGKENKFCYECPEGFVPGRLLIYKETNI